MSLASLSESIARSVAGDPWHGPSLAALLAGVTEAEAAARPVPGAHSIVELVLHTAAWMDEVAARLQGRTPGEPEAGDWPPACPWPAARARLDAAHARLQRALAGFPEARLGEGCGGERVAALGTGVTFEAMLVGVSEHNAYHGGQVALLRRALRAKP
jgi:hypothetical protein